MNSLLISLKYAYNGNEQSTSYTSLSKIWTSTWDVDGLVIKTMGKPKVAKWLCLYHFQHWNLGRVKSDSMN